MNRDHWNQATTTVYHEFATIYEYRDNLIKLFSSEIQPFQITESRVCELKCMMEENKKLQEQIQNQKQETAVLVENLEQRLMEDNDRSNKEMQRLEKSV
jgi:hypothetical protein